MLLWAFIFLMISVIAALLGFTDIAVTFSAVAKIIFFVYLSLFIITLFLYFTRTQFSTVAWLFIFFVIAVITGLLGFTGAVAAIVEISTVVFYIFLVLFIASIAIYFMAKARHQNKSGE